VSVLKFGDRCSLSTPVSTVLKECRSMGAAPAQGTTGGRKSTRLGAGGITCSGKRQNKDEYKYKLNNLSYNLNINISTVQYIHYLLGPDR
jgi:hypothetical protein